MAAHDSPELRTTEISSEDAANEVLSPATPGAEILGAPDAQTDAPAAATRTETEDEVSVPDEQVLAPATPGAETLGVDDPEDEGSQAD